MYAYMDWPGAIGAQGPALHVCTPLARVWRGVWRGAGSRLNSTPASLLSFACHEPSCCQSKATNDDSNKSQQSNQMSSLFQTFVCQHNLPSSSNTFTPSPYTARPTTLSVPDHSDPACLLERPCHPHFAFVSGWSLMRSRSSSL